MLTAGTSRFEATAVPQFEANGQEQPEEEQPQQPTIDNNAALRHGKHQKYQQRGVRGHCASESEEECSEYNRHLAEARRHNLGGIAATRALYLAGEDGHGRQLVVFFPGLAANLVHNPPSSTANNKSNDDNDSINGGGDGVPVRGRQRQRPQQIAQRSPVHRRKKTSFLRTSSSLSSDNDHDDGDAAEGGGRWAVDKDHSRGGSGRGRVGDGGARVASERSVGSSGVAWLLLYFVWLMDNVADRKYVMLFCAGDGARAGGDWVNWSRFSLLGEMHSLLPRRYKKNLAGLVVFQPTPVLHTFFEFARLFLSPKLYRKLQFCDRVSELQERFPRGVVENLPEGAVSTHVSPLARTLTRGHSHRTQPPATSDDPGGGGGVGRSGHTNKNADNSKPGDERRPSPVRISGGVTHYVPPGDENCTPPPMAPLPMDLQYPPSPRAVEGVAGDGWGGTARSGGGTGSRLSEIHAKSLERRFSSSSVSACGGNSPSPPQTHCVSPLPRSAPTQALGQGNSNGGAISTGSRNQGRSSGHTAGDPSVVTPPAVGPTVPSIANTPGSSSGLSAPSGAKESRFHGANSLNINLAGTAGLSGVRNPNATSSHNNRAVFHSVSSCTATGLGTGGVVGVRASRLSKDGGVYHMGRRCLSFGDGVSPPRSGWGLSPLDGAKPFGGVGRRLSLSSQHSSRMEDRSTPRPSPRGTVTVTPRTPVRNAAGGSPLGGRVEERRASYRSAPLTPGSEHGHSANIVDPSSTPTPATVRKTPLGTSAAPTSGWSRPTLPERVDVPAAAAGHKVSGSMASPKSRRSPKPPKSPISSSPSTRFKGSPTTKRPADGTTDSWGSDLHEHKSGATGDIPEGRKRLSYNSRTYSRRSSHDSAAGGSCSTRSSANTVDLASLAALEREVIQQSSRLLGSSSNCKNNSVNDLGGTNSNANSRSTFGANSNYSKFTVTPPITGASTAATPPNKSTVSNAVVNSSTTSSGGIFGSGSWGRGPSTAPESTSAATAGGGNSSSSVGRNPGAVATVVPAEVAAARFVASDSGLDVAHEETMGVHDSEPNRQVGFRGAATGGVSFGSISRTRSNSAMLRPTGGDEVGPFGLRAKMMASAASARGSRDDRGFGRVGIKRAALGTASRIAPGIQALISTVGTSPEPPAAEVGRVSAQTPAVAALGSCGGRPNRSHRHDAGRMRQALLEHKESMRKAVATDTAAGNGILGVAAGGGGGRTGRGGSGDAGDRVGANRPNVAADPKGKVFGVPLVKVMRTTPWLEVPWVLKRLVEFLSKYGLDSVGLFRLAGDGLDRAQLREALDNGQQICWDPSEEVMQEPECVVLRGENVNMVAQLLKAFFRELPEPLIPFSAYDKVVAIAKAAGAPDERWVQAMKGVLWSIPIANYNCLRFLFGFLRKVAANSGANRMTSENLAIVWAPNLVRPENDDPFAILKDLRFQIEAIRWMVDCFEQLFDD